MFFRGQDRVHPADDLLPPQLCAIRGEHLRHSKLRRWTQSLGHFLIHVEHLNSHNLYFLIFEINFRDDFAIDPKKNSQILDM